MPAGVIVWDIETVPDLRGFAAANGLTGRLDDEARAEMGDKFPKLIYHSFVCIGALVAQRQDEHWAVSAVGAPHIGGARRRRLSPRSSTESPISTLSWLHSTGPPSQIGTSFPAIERSIVAICNDPFASALAVRCTRIF
jgi:hypothetical protein